MYPWYLLVKLQHVSENLPEILQGLGKGINQSSHTISEFPKLATSNTWLLLFLLAGLSLSKAVHAPMSGEPKGCHLHPLAL